jgi:SAM-dependent methyltransferase
MTHGKADASNRKADLKIRSYVVRPCAVRPYAVRLWVARLCVVVVVTLAVLFVEAGLQARQQSPAPRQGRLFPPQDLGLLEFPDRATWQKPEQIMDTLQIADGSAVADIGPGAGWFTMHLAQRVGPTGKVYARDVQRPMVEAVRRRVNRAGFNNVDPLLAAKDDPRLPRGAVDAVLIVDVYQEIDEPAKYLRTVARALKPNGRIGIVNYKPGRGGPGPAERVERATVEADARAAGLRVLGHENLPYQYLLVLGR